LHRFNLIIHIDSNHISYICIVNSNKFNNFLKIIIMKKTLLFAFAFVVAICAGATSYVFNIVPVPTATAAPYPLSSIYLSGSDTVVNVTTILEDNFVPFSYTATNVTAGAALTFSYKDSQTNADAGKKGLLYKRSERAFIFDGSNRKLKISGLTNGDLIVFSIGSKGSTAHTFTVTGATADASNPALAVKPSIGYAYSTWKYTATTTEAIFVASGGCIINSIKTGTDAVTTALNPVLSDKGVSFNGTEILNPKGLSLEIYNVLGKKVASSTTSISTSNFQKGVYIVRAAGLNDSLKIFI